MRQVLFYGLLFGVTFSSRAAFAEFESIGGPPDLLPRETWQEGRFPTYQVRNWEQPAPPGMSPSVWANIQANRGRINDMDMEVLRASLRPPTVVTPPTPTTSIPTAPVFPTTPTTSSGGAPPTPKGPATSGLPGPAVVQPPETVARPGEGSRPKPEAQTEFVDPSKRGFRRALKDLEEAGNGVHGEGPDAQVAAEEDPNGDSKTTLDDLAALIAGKNDQIERTIAALRDPSTSLGDKRKGMETLLQLFQEQGGSPTEVTSIREMIRESKSETIRETRQVRGPRTIETASALPSKLGDFEFSSNEGLPVGPPSERPVAFIAADLKNAVPGLPQKGSPDPAKNGSASGPLAKGATLVPELKRISSSLIRDLASTMQSQNRLRTGWLSGGGGPALASAKRHLSTVSPTLSAAVFPGDPDSPSPVPMVLAFVAIAGSIWIAWLRSKRHPAAGRGR